MVAQRCEKISLEQGSAAAGDAPPGGGLPVPPTTPSRSRTLSPPPSRPDAPGEGDDRFVPPEASSPPIPEDLATAGAFPGVDGVLDRALALVEYLRVHCPWDRRQTARSLVPHLLEETHETVAAIRTGDVEALRSELGDLLLNLAFQVVVAEQEGRFHRTEVVRDLEQKMIRRHPHLFGLGDPEPWESIKARERKTDEGSEVRSVLSGMSSELDPLLTAHRMQEKAAGVGFDWDQAEDALHKIREELGEVEEAVAEGDPGRVEEELGDLLFAVVNVARLAGSHASPALDSANRKFRRRFEGLEALARKRGVALPGASLTELDRLWDEVKSGEGGQGRQEDPPVQSEADGPSGAGG